MTIWVSPAQAKIASIACPGKSLATEIGKLDPVETNVITVSGNCVEDVVIEGHSDLTIIGNPGATITATVLHATAPLVILNSRVLIETLTVQDGTENITCGSNSFCTFRDITSQDGQTGVFAQEQSTIMLHGQTAILNNVGTGIFLSGASSVNVRPHYPNGFDPAEPGAVISGSNTGVFVQDGSFFRSDNSAIVNNGTGVFARRGSVLKLFGIGLPAAEIANNSSHGVVVTDSSSAQVRTPVNDNGGFGLFIGPLSYVQNFGSSYSNNAAGDTGCGHFTSYADPAGTCPSIVEEVAALQSIVGDLMALLSNVSRGTDPNTGHDTLTFSGMDVQIVNGDGSTDTQNGVGNLIIGYNEARGDGTDDKTGSHMIVLGRENNYEWYGGIVSGEFNTAGGPFSSVIGGDNNWAGGYNSSVVGGQFNSAAGDFSLVVGGSGGTAPSNFDNPDQHTP